MHVLRATSRRSLLNLRTTVAVTDLACGMVVCKTWITRFTPVKRLLPRLFLPQPCPRLLEFESTNLALRGQVLLRRKVEQSLQSVAFGFCWLVLEDVVLFASLLQRKLLFFYPDPSVFRSPSTAVALTFLTPSQPPCLCFYDVPLSALFELHTVQRLVYCYNFLWNGVV